MASDDVRETMTDLLAIVRDTALGHPSDELHAPRERVVERATEVLAEEFGDDPDELVWPEDQEALGIDPDPEEPVENRITVDTDNRRYAEVCLDGLPISSVDVWTKPDGNEYVAVTKPGEKRHVSETPKSYTVNAWIPARPVSTEVTALSPEEAEERGLNSLEAEHGEVEVDEVTES